MGEKILASVFWSEKLGEKGCVCVDGYVYLTHGSYVPMGTMFDP
jgi:hypothetical protein